MFRAEDAPKPKVLTTAVHSEMNTHSSARAVSPGFSGSGEAQFISLIFQEPAMLNVRHEAVKAIAGAKHNLNRVDFKKTHVKDLFGVNVFNEEIQRQRLPKPVFKALQKTIKQGAPLDPAIADSVAAAMRDWALEKGATHYTHLFQPMPGITAEQHDRVRTP